MTSTGTLILGCCGSRIGVLFAGIDMAQLQLCTMSAWKLGDRAYVTAIVEGRDYTAYILSEEVSKSGHGYRSVGEARSGLCEYMEGLLNAVED